MNKIIIFVSCVISILLINFAMSTRTQIDNLKNEAAQLKAGNLDMHQRIKDKEKLIKRKPVLLSTAYGLVLNKMRILESFSGTNMNIQLENSRDADDISEHYMDTEFKGVRGLKIQIVVDKFSKETDMGAVLDDIYLLEKSTDFMASEISKENDNLIVKGEVYGL